jgi:hypothetical protein
MNATKILRGQVLLVPTANGVDRREPTEADRAYAERRSAQVPVNSAERVTGRFSRQLSYGNTELVIER